MASLIKEIPLAFPLNVLAPMIPQQLKEDDTQFTRAAVAISVPLIYSLSVAIATITELREWVSTPEMMVFLVITVCASWGVPLYIRFIGHLRVPVVMFIVLQYLASMLSIAALGADIVFATPCIYLPLVCFGALDRTPLQDHVCGVTWGAHRVALLVGAGMVCVHD